MYYLITRRLFRLAMCELGLEAPAKDLDGDAKRWAATWETKGIDVPKCASSCCGESEGWHGSRGE